MTAQEFELIVDSNENLRRFKILESTQKSMKAHVSWRSNEFVNSRRCY